MTDIDYDPATATPRFRFADGGRYRYAGVPSALHAAMIAADSHGRFFHDHIRDRFLHTKED